MTTKSRSRSHAAWEATSEDPKIFCSFDDDPIRAGRSVLKLIKDSEVEAPCYTINVIFVDDLFQATAIAY